MGTVLQPWVEGISWKQQSILFSGLRGPDDQEAKAVKAVCKWMRSVSQNNADPSKGYMNDFSLPAIGEGLPLERELERLSVHFVHHFADALRVIAIHCPDREASVYARQIHWFVAEELFHFVPETDAAFLIRHRDKVPHN